MFEGLGSFLFGNPAGAYTAAQTRADNYWDKGPGSVTDMNKWWDDGEALDAAADALSPENGGLAANGGLFGNEYMMGNITGLASTLMQAAALPAMMKQAKLQNQSLAHNLATAKEEQARRNTNISGFNAPRSAFTQKVV